MELCFGRILFQSLLHAPTLCKVLLHLLSGGFGYHQFTATENLKI